MTAPITQIEFYARIGLEFEKFDSSAALARSQGTNASHIRKHLVKLMQTLDHGQLQTDFPHTYRFFMRDLHRTRMDEIALQTAGTFVDMDLVKSLPSDRKELARVLNELKPPPPKRPVGRPRKNPDAPKRPVGRPRKESAAVVDWPPVRTPQAEIRTQMPATEMRTQFPEPLSQPAPVPASPLDQVRRRVVTKSALAARPKKSLTEAELREELGKKLAQVLFYVDATSLGQAKLSELAQMLRVLFEAKQLLDGKPTTILNREEKQELKTLLPRLLVEAKRRGLVMKDVKGQVINQNKRNSE
jgi:hypothetical protein